MSAATCDVCGHALHGLNEMCGADHYGDTCECDGRWYFFCACDDRFETVTDLTEHGRLCPTIAENEDYLVEGGHLDPSARLTPAPNAGWRRSEPAVIQTADPFGPDWDQREAEAAAAGLAVAAILAAAGDGTATLAIHCWPAESGTQARVYARVPADAARTLTDEHPLTRDESLLWPLWTGTVCGAPVTITTP